MNTNFKTSINYTVFLRWDPDCTHTILLDYKEELEIKIVRNWISTWIYNPLVRSITFSVSSHRSHHHIKPTTSYLLYFPVLWIVAGCVLTECEVVQYNTHTYLNSIWTTLDSYVLGKHFMKNIGNSTVSSLLHGLNFCYSKLEIPFFMASLAHF